MFYLLIPASIFGADSYIKQKIENEGKEGEAREILGGKFLLRKVHNKGAMLNFMEGRQEMVAGFSLGLALCVVLGFLYSLGLKGRGFLKFSLALVTGGALSNVCDRLVRGYVVDYFSFNVKWKKFRQVVFNISDIFIFLGSILFIFWNTHHKS
ncbi:signal peptidase II [Murimonas intestini]|mgnify:CR=1 FL=1|uniref:Lipoprotein signal peptidase n=1 Tax=Murimonas intestini TaxID=1337051 RepID=A0AB73T9I2_9FIRM|nr:signal peptidase II [Murimonas intestini]MCR1839437.1 signal peptidase II [Murimonas intestini]MCR1864732.1 signal peptidase II [Murimonas intestini]MCR1882342.1 signal peptidase II [Murimonas intestini]